MKQDDLKLVLDALKWCHGGEPCGTAQAIAVVEKALAQPKQEPVADALHFAQWTAAKKDLSDYICIGELTLAGIEDNLEGLEFGESEIERFEAVIESLQENLVTGRECKKVPLIAYIGENNTTPPQRTEPPAWFPAVENILNEYGLQAIDFVADFKEAMKNAEQSQRTWVGLTDEERQDIALEVPMDAVCITETKLKDKNT